MLLPLEPFFCSVCLNSESIASERDVNGRYFTPTSAPVWVMVLTMLFEVVISSRIEVDLPPMERSILANVLNVNRALTVSSRL